MGYFGARIGPWSLCHRLWSLELPADLPSYSSLRGREATLRPRLVGEGNMLVGGLWSRGGIFQP